MSGDNLTRSILKFQCEPDFEENKNKTLNKKVSQQYQYFLPVDRSTLYLYQANIWFEAKHLPRSHTKSVSNECEGEYCKLLAKCRLPVTSVEYVSSDLVYQARPSLTIHKSERGYSRCY